MGTQVDTPEFRELRKLIRKSLIPFYPTYYALRLGSRTGKLELAISATTETFRGFLFVSMLHYASRFFPGNVFSPEFTMSVLVGGAAYGAVGAFHILWLHNRTPKR